MLLDFWQLISEHMGPFLSTFFSQLLFSSQRLVANEGVEFGLLVAGRPGRAAPSRPGLWVEGRVVGPFCPQSCRDCSLGPVCELDYVGLGLDIATAAPNEL